MYIMNDVIINSFLQMFLKNYYCAIGVFQFFILINTFDNMLNFLIFASFFAVFPQLSPWNCSNVIPYWICYTAIPQQWRMNFLKTSVSQQSEQICHSLQPWLICHLSSCIDLLHVASCKDMLCSLSYDSHKEKMMR